MSAEFVYTKKPFVTFAGQKREFDSEAAAFAEYSRLVSGGYAVRLTNGKGYYQIVEEVTVETLAATS